MIILEGCDCTGKSTLAVRLAEHYGSEIVHYSTHEDEKMREHAATGVYGTGQIVDRFHLSEPPYSMYLRHTEPFYASVDAIDSILAMGNHLLIICVPPWETVLGLWNERINEELVKKEEVLHGIYSWYNEKAERYKIPHIRYDWTMDSLNDLYRKIENILGKKESDDGGT